MRSPTFVSQGPLGLWTTLSRRDRAWAPDAPCATLPGTIYLPFLFLLLFSLMTITHTATSPNPPPHFSPISPVPSISSRSRRTSVISQRGPTPRGVSFLRVRIALTTFARREQRRTSRRHSDLSSLPGRRHDYDLLTWTTVPESGHRGVPHRASAFPRSQIEGMEAAKSRVFLLLAFAVGGGNVSLTRNRGNATCMWELRYFFIFEFLTSSSMYNFIWL